MQSEEHRGGNNEEKWTGHQKYDTPTYTQERRQRVGKNTWRNNGWKFSQSDENLDLRCL